MRERCQPNPATLTAYVDGELRPDDAAAIADHLTTCAHCSADYHTVLDTIALTRSQLERFKAPDVLRASIRAAIATTPADHDPALANGASRSGAQRSRWWPQRAVVAAGLVLAAALGSGMTLLVR